MKRFAVGIVPEGDELSIEILEGADWRAASIQHKSSPWDATEEPEGDDEDSDASVIPDTLDEAKNDAADQGCVFDCVEIK